MLVNNCKQCQMWCSGGFARCWARWGDFGAGKFIFRCSRVSYTHLGCFGAPGGAGAGAKSLTMRSRSPSFQIRQSVPVGLALAWDCCSGHRAQLFACKISYYNSYNIITSITPFSVDQGRQGWVDGSFWVWMMYSSHYLILDNTHARFK